MTQVNKEDCRRGDHYNSLILSVFIVSMTHERKVAGQYCQSNYCPPIGKKTHKNHLGIKDNSNKITEK